MQKLLHSGTIADKISALSISIKEHPDFAILGLNKLLEIVIMHTIQGLTPLKREESQSAILIEGFVCPPHFEARCALQFRRVKTAR